MPGPTMPSAPKLPGAPAINVLDKVARAAGEAAEQAQDAARPGPTAEEQLEHLNQRERTTGRPGLVARTPKQLMLDASDIVKANPSRHFRWVNFASTDKAMNATLNGYSQWKQPDGQPVTRGNLQLWSCPREEFEERRAEREALTAASLDVDSQGRRNDSGQFYQEVEKISGIARQHGHSKSRPEHLIKDTLEGVTH